MNDNPIIQLLNNYTYRLNSVNYEDYDKNAELAAGKKVQDDNINSTKSGTEDINFTTQVYMGINLLLILLWKNIYLLN